MVLSALILLLLMLSVAAEPGCKFHKNNAICTIKESDGDYVLKKGLVSDRTEVSYILLRNCRITEIEDKSFQNLVKLTYLDLSQNKIKVLTPHVLNDSKHIRHVNLSQNLITQLDPEFFQYSIQYLDLSLNKINEIPLGFFAVADLKNLYLADNELVNAHFHYLSFQINTIMVHFDISGNNLRWLDKGFFLWAHRLEVLKVDRCSITTAVNFTRYLPNLKHLSMASNMLTRIEGIDTFITFVNLETLDLSSNSIEYVDPNAFTGNDKLKAINLRNNRIKAFDESVFQRMPMLGNLDLANNLIEHVSANSFRETPLRNLNLANNRLTYLPDNFCLELRNSKARLEKFYFNDNPWQCKCLHDILREVKRYDIEYNSMKYDGEHPVCVMKKVYSCLRHVSFTALFWKLYEEAVDYQILNTPVKA